MKTFRSMLAAMLLFAASTASAKSIEIDVNGLVCAFCAQGIDRTLREFPATADVYVSLEHRLVAIELTADGDIDDAALRKAITDAGYAVVAIRRSDATLASIRERIAAEAADD